MSEPSGAATNVDEQVRGEPSIPRKRRKSDPKMDGDASRRSTILTMIQ